MQRREPMETQESNDRRASLQRLWRSTPNTLLDALSARQHLRPHESLSAMAAEMTARLGVCPGAMVQALRWLRLDPSSRVGRLRRTELTQMATAIHRFWRQNTAQTTPAPDLA